MSITEYSYFGERMVGDIFIGTIKNDMLKKICIYILLLVEQLEDLKSEYLLRIKYEIKTGRRIKDLSNEELKALKEEKEIKDKKYFLEVIKKNMMEDELGDLTRCKYLCIVGEWEVIKPECAKCRFKSRCIHATKQFEGLKLALNADKSLSGLKPALKIKSYRLPN